MVYLTTREAAGILKVSSRTVRDLCSRGVLRCLKADGRIIVDGRDVEVLKRLVKASRAAYIIGISPRTLRKWCLRGSVRSVRIGKLYYLFEDDVEKLAEIFNINR
jgi:excisionase family DNA binding protein